MLIWSKISHIIYNVFHGTLNRIHSATQVQVWQAPYCWTLASN